VNRSHDPDTVHPPLGRYTHAVEVPQGTRLLFISGEVGIRPDGTLAEGIEGQLRQTWKNIAAILGEANMRLGDIVKVTTYVTRPEDLAVHPRIRSEVLGEHRAAATGMCIHALATPEILCEIEVVAAAPPA
jgi:enamine deaminase RidA (YjgF/YER057c/UK114 family)